MSKIFFAWLLVFVWVAASAPALGHAFSDPETINYSVCRDDVPLRQYPDTFSERITTLPKRTTVRADSRHGSWVRVIYKLKQGYFIGWCLEALLCSFERQ
jgi:uncharacterized protein YgiM (DUF1202 family)